MIIRHLHIIERIDLTEVKAYEHSYQVTPVLHFWIPTLKQHAAERTLAITARIKKLGCSLNTSHTTLDE